MAAAIALPRGGRTRPVAVARAAVATRLPGLAFATDLGDDIASARWWRGLGLMLALIAFALSFWPRLGEVQAPRAAFLDASARYEFAAQTIMPLALGGDTGRRMAPLALVRPLSAAPERARVDLVATLGAGDSVMGMLQRAGVNTPDAARAAELLAAAAGPIAPGTQVALTLGSRPAPGQPRRLDHLALRARFDLDLALSRQGEALALSRHAIAVDTTPLRIRGTVGASLYLSARAAGAPSHAIQQYLQTLDAHMSLDDLRPDDTFDMILSYQRAAGGEARDGDLLYAGLERQGQPLERLMRWGNDASAPFFDISGAGEQRATSGLVMPVEGGHLTSGFGMRFHPILGYTRMHSGIDLGAPWGAPIHAVADGLVSYAGAHGGHGNYVRLEHGSGIGTGYAHMSRIAVEPGARVRAGQVIGFVGSSGLSTGPHLHYEVYRDGRTVDPMSFRFTVHTAVDRTQIAGFKARLAKLLLVKPGAALRALVGR